MFRPSTASCALTARASVSAILPAPVTVRDDLPKEHHHGWKFIAFGPDGRLYVPIGAPCNICKADPERFMLIASMKPNGTDRRTFARGVRNSVGFDWHPSTRELWFTDNGRDLMGDDLPPDELNHAPAGRTALRLSLLPWRDNRRSGIRRRALHVANSSRQPKISVPTSPRWGCASMTGSSSRRVIAAKYSSPNTARGTVRRNPATG